MTSSQVCNPLPYPSEFGGLPVAWLCWKRAERLTGLDPKRGRGAGTRLKSESLPATLTHPLLGGFG